MMTLVLISAAGDIFNMGKPHAPKLFALVLCLEQLHPPWRSFGIALTQLCLEIDHKFIYYGDYIF